MAFPWAALATSGLSMLPGLFNRDSSGDNFNSAQAFNANEAQKARDFEVDFFSKRHQREVDDLRAAGLNPILSAGGQPPMAGGNSAQSVQPDYGRKDRTTRRYELGLNAARAIAETRLVNAQTQTQTTQQTLNNALAIQAGGKVPLINVPYRSIGNAIKNGWNSAKDFIKRGYPFNPKFQGGN